VGVIAKGLFYIKRATSRRGTIYLGGGGPSARGGGGDSPAGRGERNARLDTTVEHPKGFGEKGAGIGRPV